MQRLRGKLTYSNVVATLALFVALAGGTAFAASQLGKESVGTRQLKKGAVTPSRLSKTAKEGLQGQPGPTGPVGAQGPKGDAGAKGERGERGEAGPAVQILPAGQTETGAWSAAGAMGSFIESTLTFFPQLAHPIPPANEVYEETGATSPECPGPGRARSGYLCVYDDFETGITFNRFLGPNEATAGEGADVTGTVLLFIPSTGGANARGTWAFTAP